MEKEKYGRGCSEQKSLGEKQGFGMMMVSHWLGCRSRFLVEDATYIFPVGASD